MGRAGDSRDLRIDDGRRLQLDIDPGDTGRLE